MSDTKATSPEPAPIAPDSTRSTLMYLASQTFLAKRPAHSVIMLRIYTIGAVLLFFFVGIPLLNIAGVVPDYRVNFLGKYLCFAIVALGIDLIWGYTGLLSLCQATFFCLGGYAMAMHLSLKEGGGDVRPEYGNIPQFMFFNNVSTLPSFWKPFASFPFAVVGAILIPGIVATVFGFFILRSRVRGVYFSIITQASTLGAWLLISRNEMLLGGTNGLTNFYKPMLEDRHWIIGLYLTTLTMVLISFFICKAITLSRLGRVLVAVRDKETRLYFAGYKPYAFKVFAFAVGAMLAGIGGMLYSPQTGIITPQNMNVEASILMVIWVAVGGRGRLWGAVLGALVVNVVFSSLSSDLPSFWLYVLGGMYVLVVLLFPDGFVGLWDNVERQSARGAGILRVFVAALPIIIVVAFVLGEALTLTPAFLRISIYQTSKQDKIQLKYVVLITLLAASGFWQYWLTRAELASHGFPVLNVQPAAET